MNLPLLEEQQYKGDYHRPRRPDDSTISYLRSLPLDLELATTEIRSFLEQSKSKHEQHQQQQQQPEGDFPTTLAASLQALYEIRHELASLAGHEHAAQIIELLIHVALPVSPVAARIVLQAIQTYGLHLATHRYGSHVLQTILEVVAKSTDMQDENFDLALHDQAPELPVKINNNPSENDGELPPLSQLVANLVEELLPAVRDLAVHVCGSHVLRSLLCLLGGVQMIHNPAHPQQQQQQQQQQQPRRGKIKNKKRKRPGSAQETNPAAAAAAAHVTIVCLEKNVIDSPTAHLAIGQLMEELTGFADATQGPGILQRMACHASAAPVLAVLLQVLTYRDFASSSKQQFIQQQAHWHTVTTTPPDRHLGLGRRPEPVYAVDSDAHVLVQRILCWDKATAATTAAANGDARHSQLHAADVIYGLAGEPRGSHVLETILRLSPDSVYQDILDAGRLLESSMLREYVPDDVSNFVVQTMLSTLRSTAQAEAAVVALSPFSVDVLDPSKKRRGIVWRLTELAASPIGCTRTCQEGVVQIIRTGCCALDPDSNEWSHCVASLLHVQREGQGDARVKLDVPGTRTLYHLLQFDPALSKHVLDGLLDIPPDSLEILARDALGCRCTVDAVLLGDGTMFAEARRRLRQKLQGRWVALAIDRVGHHVVTKLFQHLDDAKEREALVKELADGKSRMHGNNMGRSVLEALEVRAYEAEGAAHWFKLIKKKQDKETWLDEIVHGGDERPRSDRKRQKQTDLEKSLKKKGQHKNTVDAIFEAISIPGGKKTTNSK